MAKNLHNLRNPFVYQGYVSPAYFCDRTEETEELIANLQKWTQYCIDFTS